ncbi:MAG TPA: hypothetical protein VGW40_05230 [Allosphingosinicella sp.]|nr:hypothetical protein [Allosphingosinicella sp.]
MRIVTTAVSFAALAGALAAAPVAAQDAGPPWTFAGELQDGDAQGEEEHRYDDHRVHLVAGQRYRLSVSSDAFDPKAQLLRAGASEVIAENDDHGETLNSRISPFTPAETGDYVLRVLGFAASARGPYTASVELLPPLPAPISARPAATAPQAWGVWQGELAASDADREGYYFDDYLVHFEAGQARMIAVDSETLDTVVQILRPTDRDGGPIEGEEDDDGGAGFNPLLGFAPTEAGDYVVRVTSFAEGATGRYRLRISQ